MATPQVFQSGVIKSAPNGNVGIDTGYAGNGVVTFRNGTFDLNETTPVTVANANVTDDSLIVFTLKTVGGTVGAYPAVQTITPGTGFTVAGSASDTSTYNYLVIG